MGPHGRVSVSRAQRAQPTYEFQSGTLARSDHLLSPPSVCGPLRRRTDSVRARRAGIFEGVREGGKPSRWKLRKFPRGMTSLARHVPSKRVESEGRKGRSPFSRVSGKVTAREYIAAAADERRTREVCQPRTRERGRKKGERKHNGVMRALARRDEETEERD